MASAVCNQPIDCWDANALAQFWSAVTGRPRHLEGESRDPETPGDAGGGSSAASTQGPEPKVPRTTYVCAELTEPR